LQRLQEYGKYVLLPLVRGAVATPRMIICSVDHDFAVFRDRWALNRHQSSRNCILYEKKLLSGQITQEVFACPDCSLIFNIKDSYNHHRRKAHNAYKTQNQASSSTTKSAPSLASALTSLYQKNPAFYNLLNENLLDSVDLGNEGSENESENNNTPLSAQALVDAAGHPFFVHDAQANLFLPLSSLVPVGVDLPGGPRTILKQPKEVDWAVPQRFDAPFAPCSVATTIVQNATNNHKDNGDTEEGAVGEEKESASSSVVIVPEKVGTDRV
jgi:uncharacterized C2H2 Zn-finger protein